MSPDQIDIWLEQSVHPQTTQFIISTYYLLPAGLDAERFLAATNWVFSHYPALYARLTPGAKDLPELVLDPTRAPTCASVDLSREADPPSALRELVRRQARIPFRMLEEPLSRAMLARTGPRSFCLLCHHHHVLMDGWGAGIVFPRIVQAYEDLGKGLEPRVEGGSYADYLERGQEPLEERARAKAIEFWKPLLAAPLPSVPPAYAGEPGEDEKTASAVEITLARALVDQVSRRAAAANATFYHAFLLAYGYLLDQRFSFDTCALSLPILNRSSEHKETIGLFTQMRATPLPLDENASVGENLNAIARRLKNVFRHYRLPPAELARLYQARGNPGNPRTHSTISYLTRNFGATLEGVFVPLMSVPAAHQPTPFTVFIFDTYPGRDIRLEFNYYHRHLNRDEAELFVQRLPHLLAGMAADPGRPLGDMDLVPAPERQRIASVLRRGPQSRPPARPLIETILERARQHPDAIAIEEGDARHSYRECVAKANALARTLVREHAVGPGDRVVLMLPRGADLIASYLAVMLAGATFVPLDPFAPATRARAICQDCEAKCVLVHAELAGKARDIHGAVLVTDGLAGDPEPWAPLAELEQIAYLIYTSGSTGAPKGVEISHRALAEHLASWLQAVPLGEAGDRVLFFSSPAFDVSIETVFPALMLGNTLVAAPHPQWTVYELAGQIVNRRLTCLYLPPAYLIEFLKHLEGRSAPLRGHAVRLCITGGDVMRAETGPLWDAVFGASALLINVYGPTEAAVSCLAFQKPFGYRRELGESIPIGSTYDGRILRIVDPRGRDVPIGAEGELLIGGIGLARGYHRMPAETRARFVTLEDGVRYFRSGDLVQLRGDGHIVFRRRRDRQVKVRGFRVELGEIEACLLENRAIKECAVLACARDGDGDTELRAFVALRENSGENGHTLRDYLLGRLPEYMVPTPIVVDQLPKSVSGKIDRQALLARPSAPDAPRSGDPAACPTQGPVQEYLALLWEQALGKKVTDARADFFELGGHSLLAAKLISKIGKAFRVAYPFPCSST